MLAIVKVIDLLAQAYIDACFPWTLCFVVYGLIVAKRLSTRQNRLLKKRKQGPYIGMQAEYVNYLLHSLISYNDLIRRSLSYLLCIWILEICRLEGWLHFIGLK